MTFLLKGIVIKIIFMASFTAHANTWILNNPYPESDDNKKIYYSSFAEQPKTLDPARSYSSNEYQFIQQIYEPLLQYDYFIRPYSLIPLIATSMPEISYEDNNFAPVTADSPKLVYSKYTIHIAPGIFFQPHPALAKDDQGKYLYLNLPSDYLETNDINQLSDFKKTGTRELIVDDYIYQIKRLADPAVNSSIYGLMSDHIVGFRDFIKGLPAQRIEKRYLDLRKYSLSGIKKIDDHTFEIKLYGQYPQFMFWLSMPFFSPIPWEADKFYSQEGMNDKNLSLDWYPIGTGPFMLNENNPNKRMVLVKNPNYHPEYFPNSSNEDDIKQGHTRLAGSRLPLIDRAIFTLEKESIPRWNKFLQGYYDVSGISADSYDQAIQLTSTGTPTLNKEMQKKQMHLTKTIDPSVYYMGFNMLDPIVGGNSERARKLRLAISIAVNYDENITIFYNGRGQAAQGPIPPGIFGYKLDAAGINPYIYEWKDNQRQRLPLSVAKKLMIEAGYPEGKSPTTGQALILHYDTPLAGGPDDKSVFDWIRKQFASIGIDLNIRATQYNRFQENMRNGNAQIFSWGWNADYPDPENFLFMLYGPNGKVVYGGENAANYLNPEYDKLFNLMKNRGNDAIRQNLIDEMVEIVRHDAPWIWGINPETFTLTQSWVSKVKPSTIGLNQLKFVAINTGERDKCRRLWNKPIGWPIGLIIGVICLSLLPLLYAYRQKEHSKAARIKP